MSVVVARVAGSPMGCDLSGGGWKDSLQSGLHLSGLKSIGTWPALVGDAALAVDDVKPVGPCGVSCLRRVREVVNHCGNAQGQLGGAGVCHRATFIERRRARNSYLLLLVIFGLPSVQRVRFQNVDHIERRAVLVLIVEFVKRGNLPAKGRSGITSENQHHRAVSAEGSKFNPRSLIASWQIEIRGRVPNAQMPGTRHKPESPEGQDHHQRFRDMPHNLAEHDGAAHDGKQATEEGPIDDEQTAKQNAQFAHRFFGRPTDEFIIIAGNLEPKARRVSDYAVAALYECRSAVIDRRYRCETVTLPVKWNGFLWDSTGRGGRAALRCRSHSPAGSALHSAMTQARRRPERGASWLPRRLRWTPGRVHDSPARR